MRFLTPKYLKTTPMKEFLTPSAVYKTAFNGINADFIRFLNTFFITFANVVLSKKI